MGTFIHQSVREFAGESLREREISGVAIRQQNRALDAKEPREFLFQFSEEHMIAGRGTRSGCVQSKPLCAFVQCAQDRRMARHPKVIAATEVNQFAPVVQDQSAINLLERRSEHG